MSKSLERREYLKIKKKLKNHKLRNSKKFLSNRSGYKTPKQKKFICF